MIQDKSYKTQYLNTRDLNWGDKITVWIPDNAQNKQFMVTEHDGRLLSVAVENPCWIQIN